MRFYGPASAPRTSCLVGVNKGDITGSGRDKSSEQQHDGRGSGRCGAAVRTRLDAALALCAIADDNGFSEWGPILAVAAQDLSCEKYFYDE